MNAEKQHLTNSFGTAKPIQLYPVVRGGLCEKDNFSGGSGVITDPETKKLSGVSTQSDPDMSWQDLSKIFKNKKVGVTEDTEIKKKAVLWYMMVKGKINTLLLIT